MPARALAAMATENTVRFWSRPLAWAVGVVVFGAGMGVVSFFGFVVRWAVSPRSEVTDIVAVLIFCAFCATWIAFAALIVGVPVVGLQALVGAVASSLTRTTVVVLATAVGVAGCLGLTVFGAWALNRQMGPLNDPIDLAVLVPAALLIVAPICFATSHLIGRAHSGSPVSVASAAGSVR